MLELFFNGFHGIINLQIDFGSNRRKRVVVLYSHSHIVLHCQSGGFSHGWTNGNTHQFTRGSSGSNWSSIWNYEKWSDRGIFQSKCTRHFLIETSLGGQIPFQIKLLRQSCENSSNSWYWGLKFLEIFSIPCTKLFYK